MSESGFSVDSPSSRFPCLLDCKRAYPAGLSLWRTSGLCWGALLPRGLRWPEPGAPELGPHCLPHGSLAVFRNLGASLLLGSAHSQSYGFRSAFNLLFRQLRDAIEVKYLQDLVVLKCKATQSYPLYSYSYFFPELLSFVLNLILN